MTLRTLKYLGYRVAPRAAARLHGWLRRRGRRASATGGAAVRLDPRLQAAALSAACGAQTAPARTIDLAFGYPAIAPNQNRLEILDLLTRLGRRPPRRLCEIGSAEGGTLFLFSRVAEAQARLISIDVSNTPERAERFLLLTRPEQQLTCLHGDSHDARIVERFREWLGADRLDFLFIDGDHSVEGVARDFELYAPAVRPGGLVAFHDIVPDYRTRYGVDTGTDAGGVPLFWKDIRSRYPGAVEIVEHRLQDGRGIGLIEV